MLLPFWFTCLSDRSPEPFLYKFFRKASGALAGQQTPQVLGSGKSAYLCQLDQQLILFVVEHYLELVRAGSVTFGSHFVITFFRYWDVNGHRFLR